MDEKKGLGLMSVLTIIFVIAKLVGLINWSWWLVFAPVFVSLGVTALILLIAGILALIDYKNGNL